MAMASCSNHKPTGNPTAIDSMAGNADVAAYLKSFKGRGALSDSSVATPPANALAAFKYPADLAMDLVLAEPSIVQPLEISFDRRGRLWLVEYNQYPYPKGMKIINVDNYLRVTFDKVPAAPPHGVTGADKITIFEDTNGDGTYDKSTDAVTGLNIATSVALGYKKIWVLNPPYLLAYPDADGDGHPDAPPEVHLQGFGMQDTHAVANSLTFGPDGWLYGDQGSTTTSVVNSAVTKKLFLEGQAVWRYHPVTHVLERFVEGGGNNPFNVEIDEKGRLFSGSNGTDRGPYYKQGGYYIKSWGKHGPLSNPYAFGYLPNMVFQGDNKRFTHAMVKYEGGSLPAHYNGKMLALNPLLNYAQVTRLETNGSTFKAIDETHLLDTKDRWFRPVDIQVGPDGALYIADWYDSRLSHVDPRDTWDKTSGRIYRLRNKDSAAGLAPFDLNTYTNSQLIALLSHKNRWFRQQALSIFSDRKDPSAIPALLALFRSAGGPNLEALWAINLSGGFNQAIATEALHHKDPFVRMWAVRLLGDANTVSPQLSRELAQLALRETHPEVRSQLASTARRLPCTDMLSIVGKLLQGHDDAADPDIPLLTWWAFESKAASDRQQVLDFFPTRSVWNLPVIRDVVINRLLQRYVMAGGKENLESATRLLQLAPAGKISDQLLGALEEALEGTDLKSLPAPLLQSLAAFEEKQGKDPLMLSVKRGDEKSVRQAMDIIANRELPIAERLGYIRVMGEINQPAAVPGLLNIVESNTKESTRAAGALRIAALEALASYNQPVIGERVVKAYPSFRTDPYERIMSLHLLASRADWTKTFLKEMADNKTIPPDDVPAEITRRFNLLEDSTISQLVAKLWPARHALTTTEKTNRIKKITALIGTGKTDPARGRLLFLGTCGSCHRLFKEGGSLAPDLSGYDRKDINTLLVNIVDPDADIREGYEVQRITTTDGRILEGKILARKGGSITFQPPLGGKEVTLTAAQVKEVRPSQSSVMPERLLDNLSDQEVKDLFSYLMK